MKDKNLRAYLFSPSAELNIDGKRKRETCLNIPDKGVTKTYWFRNDDGLLYYLLKRMDELEEKIAKIEPKMKIVCKKK